MGVRMWKGKVSVWDIRRKSGEAKEDEELKKN
jgi:hypothetical protein